MPASRWGFATAAHLLNRAGFGGPPAAVEALAALSPEAAVDRLLSATEHPEGRPDQPWTRLDPDRPEFLRKLRQASPDERREMGTAHRRREVQYVAAMQQWWLTRMVQTEHPLREKLTLFWHGHFATSFIKVREAWLMWRQNELFRRHGLGGWLPLLREVTKDPAMLLWLDQAQSRAEHPNENYARELLELFTLGEGHYTESDVTEAARALTGQSLNRVRFEPLFRPFFHDSGEKQCLGLSGNLNADDVLQGITARPQADRFITGKLWAFFAGSPPGPELADALGACFRAHGQTFGPFLRTLFLAEEFYSETVVGAQIKSPVQLLVTACRQLERALPPAPIPGNALRLLGQELFAPPSVKGWDGGASWINANTLLNRHNLALLLVEGENAMPAAVRRPGAGEALARRLDRTPPGPSDPLTWFTAEELRRPEALLAAIERRFFNRSLQSSARQGLLSHLTERPNPDELDLLAAVRLALCAPEYQLT